MTSGEGGERLGFLSSTNDCLDCFATALAHRQPYVIEILYGHESLRRLAAFGAFVGVVRHRLLVPLTYYEGAFTVPDWEWSRSIGWKIVVNWNSVVGIPTPRRLTVIAPFFVAVSAIDDITDGTMAKKG